MERSQELETERDGITVEGQPVQVVEIIVGGVRYSMRYPGDVALRFARVKRYRLGNDTDEADMIDMLRAWLADADCG